MNIKLLLTIYFIFGVVFQSFAQGDLLITPARVVFENNKQKQEINLVNIGKDSAIYSISFIQYNMKEDGSFVSVAKPDSGQMFANSYLRVFPRKVTLAPGEAQVIMLQCRRKTDMIPGEYRSHLYFRSEKDYKPLDNKASDTTNSINVQLIPIYGMAIPVIIRSGAVTVSSSLSDLHLESQKSAGQFLNLTINRNGNISVYGDLIIEFIPSTGKSFQAGHIKGIGVYTTTARRQISIKLDNTSGKPLANGKFIVKYISNGDIKPVVYAEAELVVKK